MQLLKGDCIDNMKNFDENSVDSIVTDPPAGISFMGKEWDSNKGGSKQWIKWMTDVSEEMLRVLKPGGHGLVWAIPRTSHWTATALEVAGFEIRDVITHLFGTGFPKSQNIGKKIENYDGWGTALKPASEHWILIRKPLSEKTIVKNVLKHGTGGINIDASRIGDNPGYSYPNGAGGNSFSIGGGVDGTRTDPVSSTQGRFPANLILDEEAGEILDEQSLAGGMHGAGNKRSGGESEQVGKGGLLGVGNHDGNGARFGDTGGASRFFYCPKASKKDKGADNTHPTVKNTKLMEYLIKMVTPPNGTVLDPFMGSGSTGVAAIRLGFDFIGIEQSNEYLAIAYQRIKEA